MALGDILSGIGQAAPYLLRGYYGGKIRGEEALYKRQQQEALTKIKQEQLKYQRQLARERAEAAMDRANAVTEKATKKAEEELLKPYKQELRDLQRERLKFDYNADAESQEVLKFMDEQEKELRLIINGELDPDEYRGSWSLRRNTFKAEQERKRTEITPDMQRQAMEELGRYQGGLFGLDPVAQPQAQPSLPPSIDGQGYRVPLPMGLGAIAVKPEEEGAGVFFRPPFDTEGTTNFRLGGLPAAQPAPVIQPPRVPQPQQAAVVPPLKPSAKTQATIEATGARKEKTEVQTEILKEQRPLKLENLQESVNLKKEQIVTSKHSRKYKDDNLERMKRADTARKTHMERQDRQAERNEQGRNKRHNELLDFKRDVQKWRETVTKETDPLKRLAATLRVERMLTSMSNTDKARISQLKTEIGVLKSQAFTTDPVTRKTIVADAAAAEALTDKLAELDTIVDDYESHADTSLETFRGEYQTPVVGGSTPRISGISKGGTSFDSISKSTGISTAALQGMHPMASNDAAWNKLLNGLPTRELRLQAQKARPLLQKLGR